MKIDNRLFTFKIGKRGTGKRYAALRGNTNKMIKKLNSVAKARD